MIEPQSNFKNLAEQQIENCLLMCDVSGRFERDVEYLEFKLNNKDKTEADVKRILAVLRRAQASGVRLGFCLRGDL